MTLTHAQLAERCAELFQTVQVPDSVKPFIAELLEALREAEADRVRMDYLEQEMEVEAERQNASKPYFQSLFRRNTPITRAAIDAILNPEAKT